MNAAPHRPRITKDRATGEWVGTCACGWCYERPEWRQALRWALAHRTVPSALPMRSPRQAFVALLRRVGGGE